MDGHMKTESRRRPHAQGVRPHSRAVPAFVRLTVSSEADAVERVVRRIEQLDHEDQGIAMIVVGMPSRLDGTPTPQTAHVQAFIARLKARTPLPIATEDERLTSVEAESRLARREKDWRKRKAQLDAAAAAVFLQDYLDRA